MILHTVPGKWALDRDRILSKITLVTETGQKWLIWGPHFYGKWSKLFQNGPNHLFCYVIFHMFSILAMSLSGHQSLKHGNVMRQSRTLSNPGPNVCSFPES